MVVALYGTDLAEKVGKLNMARFDRGHLIGSRVNSEQSSGIVDPSIKNGFYGAPSAVCVFCQKDFAFSVPDAFVIAQAMALEAHGLGESPAASSAAASRHLSPKKAGAFLPRGAFPKTTFAALSLHWDAARGHTRRRSPVERGA